MPGNQGPAGYGAEWLEDAANPCDAAWNVKPTSAGISFDLSTCDTNHGSPFSKPRLADVAPTLLASKTRLEKVCDEPSRTLASLGTFDVQMLRAGELSRV